MGVELGRNNIWLCTYVGQNLVLQIPRFLSETWTPVNMKSVEKMQLHLGRKRLHSQVIESFGTQSIKLTIYRGKAIERKLEGE